MDENDLEITEIKGLTCMIANEMGRVEKKNSRLQFSPYLKCPPDVAYASSVDRTWMWTFEEKKRQLPRVTERSTGCEPLISSSRGIVDPSRRFLASELAKVRQEKKNNS